MSLFAAAVAACGSDAGPKQNASAAAPVARLTAVRSDDRLAFPGAEGHGRGAAGGRGGRIIAVTTLADAGPGSLRACIDAAGPRVCVFRVAGLIRYTTRRPMIQNPFITIAGETAPGGGILIAHAGGKGATTPFVIKDTHDVVVRHIRVRNDRDGELRRADSAFIIENSDNVILDHVSSSWARDENVGGYAQNDRITISWSIFAQGTPRHDKCALLSSDPKGPQRVSFLHNLCAHNGDRNPDVNFAPGSCVEVVNNVLYDASLQFTEIWESYGGTPVNVVGNIYRRGPSTSREAFAIDRPLIGSTGRARIYQRDNLIDGDGIVVPPVAQEAFVAAPVCPLSLKPAAARDAYPAVLAQAGAFPRDWFDERMVSEVRTRTGHIGMPDRTLPLIDAGVPYPDSDGDGMADGWERARGLDPAVNDAWRDRDGDGWANLEEFLDFAHRERLAGRAVR
ncbi:pectate lyase [Sphingomonas sp. SUN019]|uniref:pectate lyase n=1 Tax=Sphingomonas sp. SUN019 TaxID=2937788 RepID=UPI002164492F|nr:pectate lyase [Sphingomonas sp. SUN019]UVO51690.1 pectate lyase [Sphingomonas sp. SUN019]